MPLIENCALNLGLPIGPLAVQDDTTLKLGLDVMTSTKEELGDKYIPNGTEPFYELMVTDHYPLSADQPSAEDVKQRLLYAQLVPTANCYAAGVVPDPQSADLGAIFGWGFPVWTGGPLSYIDTVGLKTFVATADMLAQRHGAQFTPPQMFRDMAASGQGLYDESASTPIHSKSSLQKMLEVDIVKLANAMGISASVDDLKADTIQKILKAQDSKSAA